MIHKITSSTVGSIAFLLSSYSYSSSITSLDKMQLQTAAINKTFSSIAIDNLNGKTINNIFSMYMDKHGNIFGKMSVKPANLPQYDQGTYTIDQDGTFYITWQHWDEHKKICGHLFETKDAYISIDCDNVFHTVFMKDKILLGNKISK